MFPQYYMRSDKMYIRLQICFPGVESSDKIRPIEPKLDYSLFFNENAFMFDVEN